MRRIVPTSLAVLAAVSAVAITSAGSDPSGASPATAKAAADGSVFKEAKLNIEHNATDRDTGFQWFVDSEGIRRFDATGPSGKVLGLEASVGALGRLGITEMFFETVEPENAKIPRREVLAQLPAGTYSIEGERQESGESKGPISGKALLTHDIPAGPKLVAPKGERVPVRDAVARWRPVSTTLTGKRVRIIAYQLIIEKDAEPHPHMIGKQGSLSMYLRPSVTRIDIPDGFLERRTAYQWEVLAIERSGNQTLSSGEFRTR